MIAPLLFLASALASTLGEALPPSPSCPSGSGSTAAALALYDAMPTRIDDDAEAVKDLAFMQALAAPRDGNEGVVRWRFREPAYAAGPRADGIEGSCTAVFDVATSGGAINVAVNCTNPRFEAGMRNAMLSMLFLPALKDGAPIVQRRIAQPVLFCLEE